MTSFDDSKHYLMDGWIEGDRLEGEKRGDHIKDRREKRET